MFKTCLIWSGFSWQSKSAALLKVFVNFQRPPNTSDEHRDRLSASATAYYRLLYGLKILNFHPIELRGGVRALPTLYNRGHGTLPVGGVLARKNITTAGAYFPDRDVNIACISLTGIVILIFLICPTRARLKCIFQTGAS